MANKPAVASAVAGAVAGAAGVDRPDDLHRQMQALAEANAEMIRRSIDEEVRRSANEQMADDIRNIRDRLHNHEFHDRFDRLMDGR